MVATSASLSDGSFEYSPMVRSMCHGGISREVTLVLIARAQGRTSAKVMSDIGAGVPGRWQLWQERCMIGKTSLVNVGPPEAGACATTTDCAASSAAPARRAPAEPASNARRPETYRIRANRWIVRWLTMRPPD
jgi:hypothetical protein